MSEKKIGVLLVNLGTPDEPTPSSVRRYLKEFLSDKRVVDLSRWIWWPVLNLIILRFRPRRVAKLYRSIWTDGGSPMRSIMEKQKAKLIDWFCQSDIEDKLGVDSNISIKTAMTYGNPSVRSRVVEIIEEGCEKLVVLPLFPQYSASTTGAAFDVLAIALMQLRNIPELVFIKDYYHHPLYIQAVKCLIEEHWQRHGKAQHLIFSFHGIPKRYYDLGDPYPDQCVETATQIASALGLQDNDWSQAYQSRFGREEWVQPYLDEVLQGLPKQGIKSVDVISPAFSADCLETLEELKVELKEVFLQSGGENYRYIPALNDRDDHIALLGTVLLSNMT